MHKQSIPQMSYNTERDLVDAFVISLEATSSPWGLVRCSEQFNYVRGRTDVVAVDLNGEVIAIEAKLSAWRKALHQAYRNTCFANRSYVLLPKQIALTAARYQFDFGRRNVGLCYVSAGVIIVVYDAPFVVPIQPWLTLKAAKATQDRIFESAST